RHASRGGSSSPPPRRSSISVPYGWPLSRSPSHSSQLQACKTSREGAPTDAAQDARPTGGGEAALIPHGRAHRIVRATDAKRTGGSHVSRKDASVPGVCADSDAQGLLAV